MVEDPNPLGNGARENERGNDVGTSHQRMTGPILVDEHSDFFVVSPRQLQGTTSLSTYYYYYYYYYYYKRKKKKFSAKSSAQNKRKQLDC